MGVKTRTNHRAKVFGCIAALVCMFPYTSASRGALLTVVETLDDFLTMLQRPKKQLETNQFLKGNFAPVTDEHVSAPIDVAEGAIPKDFEGMFVRNGPNPLQGWTKRYHLFDGHGMLHSIRFKGGKATYTNQFVPTPRLAVEKKYGKDYFVRLGEAVGIIGIIKVALLEPIKRKAHGMTALTDGTANTNSLMFNDRFYLLNEGNIPFEVHLNDDGTITSVGFSTFGGVLDYPVSAHPKIDLATKSLLFHSYAADPQLVKAHGPLKVGELLEDGTVRNYNGISRNHTSFVHDMLITKNWMVLLDQSVHFDIASMVKGKSALAWNQNANLEVILVSRSTGEIKTFDVGSPKGMLHPMNAWEEESDGTVVVWLPLADQLNIDLDEYVSFNMTEIRLNPTTGLVTMEGIHSQYNQEFCGVHRDFYGRFARYGVAGMYNSTTPHGSFGGFNIWDMQEKKVINTVHFANGECGGEPVLIAKRNSKSSRDFYVGTFVINVETGKTSFAVYEEETLVFRLEMPYRVPLGFHGNWIPEDVLQRHIVNRKH